jgi:hypothetical protein
MWKTFTLRLPKTPEGVELSQAMREAASGARNGLSAFLAHVAMAWICSDKPKESWTPFKVRETVRCRLDVESVLTAPLYRAWEFSQSQMPFADWLSMASYYGFIRAKKDPLLTAMLSPFLGGDDPYSPPNRDATPVEVIERPAAKQKPKMEELAPRKPRTSVKSLKGMF